MNWTREQIDAVWKKGKVVESADPNNFRKDFEGNWIKFDKYGVDRNIQYQWEIHHNVREIDGGSDDISNLWPLHGITNAELQ